jgi:hypothetical protein
VVRVTCIARQRDRPCRDSLLLYNSSNSLALGLLGRCRLGAVWFDFDLPASPRSTS